QTAFTGNSERCCSLGLRRRTGYARLQISKARTSSRRKPTPGVAQRLLRAPNAKRRTKFGCKGEGFVYRCDHMAKSFYDLSEKDILALAISLEEEDGRIYGEFAERMRSTYPRTADALDAMREEESGHRHHLTESYCQRFGDYIPLLRRQDVKGFVNRKPIWLNRILTVDQVRNEIGSMEQETKRFYEAAAQKSTSTPVRQLLNDLAQAESKHLKLAEELEEKQVQSGQRREEDEAARRTFVLQVVQPGLAGLMDGSVSTLAPVFAAAFATRNSWDAF